MTARTLLENESSHQYALGLYMDAIEEYGKAEILRDYVEKSTHPVPDWVFGKGKYGRKLGEGIKRLQDLQD
ncbi:MAG TPA: hypothetical protein VEL11_03105 [Candidatus Bathyarchaeia archaeon]|nr:hypothetical protein [Candidatus Bathyarchaeia archaeon]